MQDLQVIRHEVPAQGSSGDLPGEIRLTVQKGNRLDTRSPHWIVVGVVGSTSSAAIRGRRDSARLPARDA